MLRQDFFSVPAPSQDGGFILVNGFRYHLEAGEKGELIGVFYGFPVIRTAEEAMRLRAELAEALKVTDEYIRLMVPR